MPPTNQRLRETPASAPVPSSPFDTATWAEIVRQCELSPQQARIVELILLGKRDKEIADELGLSFSTVRAYLSRVFDRVGVRDRVELVLRMFSAAEQIRAGNGRHQD